MIDKTTYIIRIIPSPSTALDIILGQLVFRSSFAHCRRRYAVVDKVGENREPNKKVQLVFRH